MSELRPATIKQIEQILDRSYFAIDSFQITNNSEQNPFLSIIFLPNSRYKFEASKERYSSANFTTTQSPGEHMSIGEKFTHDGFDDVISDIDTWVRRIEDDFRSKTPIDGEVADFIENLKSKISQAPDDQSYFTSEEVEELRSKLTSLEDIVLEQAKKLEDSEQQISNFKKELNAIKQDVERFPKGVWYKVSGNKLIRAVKGFISTQEGRQLISEGIKRLLEWK